jgi:protein TonB
VLYSVVFHLVLLVLAFILVRNKLAKQPAPFVATIVTPEELQKQEPFIMPRLPKNLPRPEKFSAVPSSKSRSSTASRKSSPPSNTGHAARAREAAVPQRPAAASPQGQEQGLAEQQKPLVRSPANEDKNKDTGVSSHAGHGPNLPGTARDILRDKDIYKDIVAKHYAEGAGRAKNDNGITFDTKEIKYWGYMQRLKEQIEGAMKYPEEAAQRNISGEVYIRFTIKKDGRLGDVELLHTSGYKMIDDAALRALRDAAPYWPLPDEWNEASLTVPGHFIYNLYNTAVR